MAPVPISEIGNLLHLGVLKSHTVSGGLFELLAGVSLFVLATSIARLVALQRSTARERERLYLRQRDTQLLGLAARRAWERDC